MPLGTAGVESLQMREPPITITCDCGTGASLAYGERWTLPDVRQDVEHGQIPRQEYDALLRHVRRYRLMVLVPPSCAGGDPDPARRSSSISASRSSSSCSSSAFALLVIPPLRRRASDHVLTQTPSWQLRPE